MIARPCLSTDGEYLSTSWVGHDSPRERVKVQILPGASQFLYTMNRCSIMDAKERIDDIPKCPVCGSDDIKRISAPEIDEIYSECRDCGSEWN